MKSRFQRAEPSLSFEGADEDEGTPPPRLGPAEKF